MDSDSQSIPPAPVKAVAVLLAASAGLRIVDFVVRAAHNSALRHGVWAGQTVMLLLFALVFLRGKNWARWLYLLIIVTSLFLMPSAFQRALSARSTFSTVYLCLQVLLQATPAILLFLKPSNAWFRKSRGPSIKSLQAAAAPPGG
jgi:cell division protein FtsW (lipid II flippase)